MGSRRIAAATFSPSPGLLGSALVSKQNFLASAALSRQFRRRHESSSVRISNVARLPPLRWPLNEFEKIP